MIQFNYLETHKIAEEIKIINWIKQSIIEENKTPFDINIIICSDEYLLEMNKKYLNHDYYTDVITFDYSSGKKVSGDIFISLDRIKENAKINNIKTENELNRIIIHGILHLCGYKDKIESDKKLMTFKEDYYLNKL